MSPETKQAAPFSPVKNRRYFSRRDVRSLAYIDLGRDNGGIVLNLSEGGLAIHSAIMLNERRLAHLRFQLPQSTEWVEAKGEVAWTSESKMQAGIQLIGLSDNARKHIREWVGSNIRPAPTNVPKPDWSARPLNSLRVQALPIPAMPPDPPLPASLPGQQPKAQEKLMKYSELAQATSRVATPAGASNGSKEIAQRTPALPTISGTVQNATPQLGLRLGQVPPNTKSRPVWMKWGAFTAFLLGMAVLSFFAGLRTGKGDSRSLVSSLLTTGAGPGSATPSQAVSPVPLVGRVTISSRLYVPVSIPPRSAETKTNRLQVGAIAYRRDPDYPVDAQKQHTEGTVQLHATIGANGSVENVTVLNGPPVLVDAASTAVRQWRFKPTQLDGKAIETEADIAIVFWMRPAVLHPQSESK